MAFGLRSSPCSCKTHVCRLLTCLCSSSVAPHKNSSSAENTCCLSSLRRCRTLEERTRRGRMCPQLFNPAPPPTAPHADRCCTLQPRIYLACSQSSSVSKQLPQLVYGGSWFRSLFTATDKVHKVLRGQEVHAHDVALLLQFRSRVI